MISIPFKERKGGKNIKSKPPNPKKFLRRGEGKWSRIGDRITKSSSKSNKVAPARSSSFIQKLRAQKKQKNKDSGSNPNDFQVQVHYKPPPTSHRGSNKANGESLGDQVMDMNMNMDNDSGNGTTRQIGEDFNVNQFDILINETEMNKSAEFAKSHEPKTQQNNENNETNEQEMLLGREYDFDEQVQKYNEQDIDVDDHENGVVGNNSTNNLITSNFKRNSILNNFVNTSRGALDDYLDADGDDLFKIDVPGIGGQNPVSIHGSQSFIGGDLDLAEQKSWNTPSGSHQMIYGGGGGSSSSFSEKYPRQRRNNLLNSSFESQMYINDGYDEDSPLTSRLFDINRRSSILDKVSVEERLRVEARRKLEREEEIRKELEEEEKIRSRVYLEEMQRKQIEASVRLRMRREEEERKMKQGLEMERLERERRRIEMEKQKHHQAQIQREREMRMKEIAQKKKSNGFGKMQQQAAGRGKASSMVQNMFYQKDDSGHRDAQKKKINQWKKKVEVSQREDDMKKKLDELEKSLLHFRKENEKLNKIRQKLEIEKMNLINEREETKRLNSNDKEKFEKYRDRELKTIRREKKLIDRQKRKMKKLEGLKGVSKEKEELEKKIEKMEEEHKIQIQRLKTELEKYKRKNSSLSGENKDLKKIIKKMELEKIDKRFAKKSRNVENDGIMEFSYNNNNKVKIKRGRVDVQKKNEKRREEESDEEEEQEIIDINGNEEEEESAEEEDDDENENNNNDDEAEYLDEENDVSELTKHIKRLRKLYVSPDTDYEPTEKREKIVSRKSIGRGKIEIVYKSGRKETIFPNKTRKCEFPGGFTAIYFNNGDFKKTFPSGKVVYYYDTAKASHISFPNNLEVIHFPNEQIERTYPDGYKEVLFPDKAVKYIHSNGILEEIHYPNGTVHVLENVTEE